ncbi:MFS transporter [Streptomyces sp. NPDC050698]
MLRLLYGIGMGGEWGLGAALAMEKTPTERRGFWSGLLQSGYSLGYLLAAVAPVRVQPAARPGRAVGAQPGGGERGVGEERPAQPNPRAPGVQGPGGAAALRVPGRADDRLQLDVARHPGHLPHLREEGPRPVRGGPGRASRLSVGDGVDHRAHPGRGDPAERTRQGGQGHPFRDRRGGAERRGVRHGAVPIAQRRSPKADHRSLVCRPLPRPV